MTTPSFEEACDEILRGGNPFGDNAEDKKLQATPQTELVIGGQSIDDIANNTRAIEERCQEIWAGDNTLDKIADFVQERHYGDRIPIKMILLASMQHRIPTITELSYISINAESGGGKSDLVRSVAEILPADAVKFGTVSAKYLPRIGADWDGKIIILDDQQPDADNIEYMKLCCVNTTIRPTYGTLIPGTKGEPAYKAEELPLPMRLCYIIARVDTAWGTDAEQVQNRIITVYLDDSEEQKQRVLKKMTERMQVDYVDYHQKTAEIMREKLWMGLPDQIHVDFRDIIGHIDAKNIENRMYGHLINMIASNAVYRQWPGSEAKWDEVNGAWLHDDATTHAPIIYANKDDAIPVIGMFNSFLTIPAEGSGDANAGGNVYKFFGGEKRVHDAILERYSEQSIEWKSVTEMSKDLGISYSTLHYALNGRTPRKAVATEGLLTKMPGLDMVQVSKSEDNTLMTPEEIKEWESNHGRNIIETGVGDGRTIRKYDAITWDCKAYWQDRDARQAVIKWID